MDSIQDRISFAAPGVYLSRRSLRMSWSRLDTDAMVVGDEQRVVVLVQMLVVVVLMNVAAVREERGLRLDA